MLKTGISYMLRSLGNISMITYADDTTLLISSSDLIAVMKSLNSYHSSLEQFSSDLFRHDSKKVNPKLNVNINGKRISTVKTAEKIDATFLSSPLIH